MGMDVRAAVKQKTCPFCFERFWLGETPFRCNSLPTLCEPEVDTVLATHGFNTLRIGKVIAPQGRFAQQATCRACKQTTRQRICPHCHMELPPTIVQFDNYIFAVIGAKESGKSHYIAVLIDQFRRSIGPQLNALLEPANDATMRRYQDDFYMPVFRDKRTIDATGSGVIASATVRIPLIYSLVFRSSKLFGFRDSRRGVALVFFDTAGEDLNSEEVMSNVNKYIHRSDGIILLLDPLQLQSVRAGLPGGTPLPEQNTETSEIVTRTTRLIRLARRMNETKPVDTPLAVTFSKIDALDPLLDSASQLRSNPYYSNRFDVMDSQAVSDEVEALIGHWQDGEQLIQQIKMSYKHHRFFGLSALGCNPHNSKVIPTVTPRRVPDPLLWLLHHHRYIQGNN